MSDSQSLSSTGGTSSSPVALPPSYTAVETLHRGPRYRVLRALDPEGRAVVLKIPLSREPRLGHRLRHELDHGRSLAELFDADARLAPHRLSYLALVDTQSLAFEQRSALVVEDVGGVTLDRLLPADGFELEPWLDLAIQAAQVLAGLHQHRLIHKQIQPSHMLIGRDEKLRFIGLGQSSYAQRELIPAMPVRQLESSLAYLSPEQTGRMGRPVDYRTDLYSLGMSLYQLLVGRLPFPTTDIAELIHCHLAKEPPSPKLIRPDLPVVVVDILNRLLAKNAEDRYPGAESLLLDLERCRRHLTDSGTIPTFPVARRRRGQNLQLPSRLYGRDAAVGRLHMALERCRSRPEQGVETLLIEGAPGTGKSSLPLVLHRPVARDRGHLVVGRFDRFRRDIPFSAWTKIFTDLCRYLLTESPEILESRRRQLVNIVGEADTAALGRWIPALALVSGLAVPPQDGGSRETANRLLPALGRLLTVFATPRHPLVVLLDSLQWADSSSLQLFRHLVVGEPIPHCLMLAAYDPKTLSDIHPMSRALASIEEETGLKLPKLVLDNLSPDELLELLEDTFEDTPADLRPLAELVHAKTAGNPHFVRQFILSLYDQGLVHRRSQERPEPSDNGDSGAFSTWTWDLESVRALAITDNVVELLTRRIDSLPEDDRHVLKLAACLGETFELGALARAAGLGRGATLRRLGGPLAQHLLVVVSAPPSRGEEEEDKRWFRFSHEQVRQAAYESLDRIERRRLHLQIARRLHTEDDALRRHLLFETLAHYLRAEAEVDDPDERLLIVELALAAGEQALGAGAYPAAADFLEDGLRLIDETTWSRAPTLAFEVHRAALGAFGMATRFQRTEQLFEALQPRPLNRDERVSAGRAQLENLITQGRYDEALQLAAELLRLLAVNMPRDEDEAAAHLQLDLESQPVLLAGREVEDLRHAPPLTDGHQGRILKILGSVATAAYPSGRPHLVAWAGCRRVNIILRYGLQPADALSFAAFAYSTLIFFRQDYETAYRFGKLAVETVEESSSLSARCRGLLMFAANVEHWCRPLGESLPRLRRALRYGIESGDLIFSSYSVWYLFTTRFQMGAQLEDLEKEAQAQLSFLQRSYKPNLEGAFRPSVLQPVHHLLGRTKSTASFDGTDFSETTFLENEGRNPYFRALYLGSKLRGLYWLGRIPEALDLVDERRLIERSLFSISILPEFMLFIGLTLTAAFDAMEAEDQTEFLAILDEYEARFALWCELCPDNIQPKYFLLRAERARLDGRQVDAERFYRQSIDGAASVGQIQFEALGNELFGNFWKHVGEPTGAVGYWLRAVDLYARWGARAKVEQLQASQPELRALRFRRDGDERRASGPLEDVGLATELDLDHALRASRAISSELRPDQLLESLMRSVVEAAGARRGCLLLARGSGLGVEVEVQVGQGAGAEVRVCSVPLDDYSEIAHSVIHFVHRTGEDVVLGDALGSARFGSDPHLVAQGIPSVLCLPMLRHGEPAGMLYLENRLAAHVFTSDRVTLLHTLLAQAAISLENAHLYEDLAREIHERKAAEEQLRRYNAELEAKNAELERFTYTVSHDLRSPLVTIKGFLGLLEEDAKSGETQSMMDDIARITHATDHMSALLEDLLKLSRIGHQAGPPSEIPLLELVQETLELLTIPLLQAGIEIQLKPPFATVYGDRIRLREVFQNLIENATKFMGDQASPRIEIGCRQEDEATCGSMVTVFVRDNGAGIAEDHQDVIFGLFEQLDQKMEGTGVGLTLVRRIVEVHGGKISVESDGPGKGATFLFTLPTSPTSSEPEPEIPELEI